MRTTMVWCCLFALLLCSPVTMALSDEEIAAFGSRGIVEHNSGATGKMSLTRNGSSLVIHSNGIPDTKTGEFPGLNPYTIKVQRYEYKIPTVPSISTRQHCLPRGPIGFATNGVPFFNPFTDEGYNAVDGPFQQSVDGCDGHLDPKGRYHYRGLPGNCLLASKTNDELSGIIGVALDGFPVYGPLDEQGRELTADDLDICHGRFVDGSYRYHLTKFYPYWMGCFKGMMLRDSGLDHASLRDKCYVAKAEFVNGTDDRVPYGCMKYVLALKRKAMHQRSESPVTAAPGMVQPNRKQPDVLRPDSPRPGQDSGSSQQDGQRPVVERPGMTRPDQDSGSSQQSGQRPGPQRPVVERPGMTRPEDDTEDTKQSGRDADSNQQDGQLPERQEPVFNMQPLPGSNSGANLQSRQESDQPENPREQLDCRKFALNGRSGEGIDDKPAQQGEDEENEETELKNHQSNAEAKEIKDTSGVGTASLDVSHFPSMAFCMAIAYIAVNM